MGDSELFPEKEALEDSETVTKKIKLGHEDLNEDKVEITLHENSDLIKAEKQKEETTATEIAEQGKDEIDLNDEAYSYTRRGQFTSELFKVEIQNLPKFTTVSDLKKLFKNKIDIPIKPLKAKVIRSDKGKAMYGFVTFQNEQERAQAIEKLNGIKYKNSQLRVFKAKPKKDPFVQQKQMQQENEKIDYDKLSEQELHELIYERICPLWKLDYQTQLNQKQQNYRQFVDELFSEIKQLYKQSDQDAQEKTNESFTKWLESTQQIPLDFIRSHDQVNGYRNKCEFSVGRDCVVGFRLESYKRGSLEVIAPGDDCPILNEITLKLARAFETFVRQSDLPPADNEKGTGHWKTFTVRNTSQGCLVIVHINSRGLESTKLGEAKKSLIDFFSKFPEITSLYLNSGSGRTELLSGESYISEVMGDRKLKFRISPYSFFQINLRAAEICYNAIGELLGLNQKMFLLDVCCGTGTIGLYLAHQVKKVFGVEINKEAINDAKQNAKINKIENAEFVDGNAEQKIFALIQRAIHFANSEGIQNPEIVAILDPPRAGLHKSLVKSLRNCEYLKKFVYVSCEPKFARQNLIDFCRPSSKMYLGQPFCLSRSVPVDMFPHSQQCELLLLYEREIISEGSSA